MELLPLVRLSVMSHDRSENALAINERFIPPFMQIMQDNPLMSIITGLLVDVRRCRDKALDALSQAKAADGQVGEAANLYTTLRFRVLNIYEIRLSALMGTGHLSPYSLYLELISFLAELMALYPHNSITAIAHYNHDDYGPQFTVVIKDIRSFILSGGSVDYRKLDFFPIENGQYLFTRIKMEDLIGMKDVYLAVKTNAAQNDVIPALETGDTFKLINPEAKTQRIRGIKLISERFPPRYLPVIKDTLWFHLDITESAPVWREVREEKGVVLDYAPDLFPSLEAALYISLESS
jgi:predicted component of type VI protein secretion system